MALPTLLEMLGYVVTILGLPTAIFVFVYQQKQQRQNEAHELHRRLSEEYDNFLKLALDNADLLLIKGPVPNSELTEEQKERQYILFSILVSLFEKAYIILYSDHMTTDTGRLWMSWEDDMREWCRREEFRIALPSLLQGEDSRFSERIRAIAKSEAGEAAGA